MTHIPDESRAQLIASQQAEELAQLNRIAVALTSEFDLQRLLQMITDAARKVTSAQYAAFFLIPEIVGNDENSVANDTDSYDEFRIYAVSLGIKTGFSKREMACRAM